MGSFWAPFCLLLAVLTSVCCLHNVSSKSHFMVVAPRRLLAGKVAKIWVTLGEENFPFTINLRTKGTETEQVLTSVNYIHMLEFSPDAEMPDVHLPVPFDYLGKAILEVEYGDSEHKSKRSAEVDIEHIAALTFIETDRPFYKPGELVRFRFLLLQHKLQPVTNGIKIVWVENPVKVRMAQWHNIQTHNGLAQVEMQLSEEPVQGVWNIKLQANNISEVVSKSFEVKEYVLPKFEVIISAPKYITYNSKDLVWTICAKYSYGKPVQGHVLFNVSFMDVVYYNRQDKTSIITSNSTQVRKTFSVHKVIDYSISFHPQLDIKTGCYEFHLPDNLLKGGPFRYAISVRASVEEDGTGEVQEASDTSPIHRDSIEIKFVNSADYFMPYLPYHGKLLVTQKNGEPVQGQTVKIVLKVKKTIHSPWFASWNLPHHDTKNFTSDSNGFISFIIPPQTKETHTIFLEATINSDTLHAYTSKDVKQWYSPSDSYIQIVDNSYQTLKCGKNHALSILYTIDKNSTKNIKFTYLVQSRGDIVKQVVREELVRDSKLRLELRPTKSNITLGKMPAQVKMLPVGRWNLKLDVSPNMSPLSQLLIYYVRANGEVVAASHTLHIVECLNHKVKTSFSHEKVQPGAKVTLKVAPESRSFCAISAVDKAVTFLAGDNALNENKVFKQLKRFDIGPAPRERHHCFPGHLDLPDMLPIPLPQRHRLGRKKRTMLFNLSPDFGNTEQAFSDAGMLIISNLETDPSPCTNDDPGCNPCPRIGLSFHPGMHFAMMRGAVRADEESASIMQKEQKSFVNSPTSDVMYESDAVEPPLVEIRSLFPETWLWNLEQFDGPEERQFELETPHSITDWIVNAVCVSVADGLGIAPPTSLKVFKPYFMDFTIPYSIKRGEILPLKVSLFNYLNHALPVRLTFGNFTGGSLLNEQTYLTCLDGHTSLFHQFRLQPTELGEHNITVTANVDPYFPAPCGPELLTDVRDGLMKKIVIKPEGFPVDVTNSVFICLSDEEEHASISWDINLPENLVNGSFRSFVSVIGDVMGPSLENLDKLVQLPMGCGEQNMLLFVPNILVLNYLNASGQSNLQLRNKALSHMKKGYERELKYRHLDGSYSAFGMSDPVGSMWLTAFVVKSFAQANKFIFIDNEDLKLSMEWIIKNQLENGCFPFIGKVFHKDMKGGLGEDSSPIALTAYVLISLMETGLEIDDKILSNGLFCLLGKEDQDLYTLVLTTYALTLMHDIRANLVTIEQVTNNFNLLMAQAVRENDEMRFEKSDSKSLSLNLEITAYVVLILTKLGGHDNLLQALSAVRWMSKHRNANGGFVSTQDTMVALEALAKYAVKVPNHNVTLQINASTVTKDWLRIFSIDTNNQLVLQQSSLPVVPPAIHFLAQGHGCALLQSNVRYNIKNASAGREAFKLVTTVTPIISSICSQLLFEASVFYNLLDGESNMAVMEIDLLSGYIPDKYSLDALRLDPAVKLKRWDQHSGQVNLYFDSLTADTVNINFIINQEVEVENPKPAQVRVLDYYTPELTTSTSYGLEDVKCLTELLPEPIAVNTETISSMTTSQSSTTNTLEVADEPVHDTPPKATFESFTNVDHDLEFPEGNEGVEPVYVPAPSRINKK